MASEHQDLLRALRRHPEFEIRRSRNNHWRVTRAGRYVTMLPSTPGEYRGLKNALAALRRAGFQR